VVVLVVVLVVTNLAMLGTLLWFLYGPQQHPAPDDAVAKAIEQVAQRAAFGARRVITIEILNPIELAGTRGRLVGMAGSLAPGLTRRIVYDQAVRNMKRQLAEEHVVADVRVHLLPTGPPAAPRKPVVEEPIPYIVDEPAPVDLTKGP
jgi:hypothetical protein